MSAHEQHPRAERQRERLVRVERDGVCPRARAEALAVPPVRARGGRPRLRRRAASNRCHGPRRRARPAGRARRTRSSRHRGDDEERQPARGPVARDPLAQRADLHLMCSSRRHDAHGRAAEARDACRPRNRRVTLARYVDERVSTQRPQSRRHCPGECMRERGEQRRDVGLGAARRS